MLEHNLLLHYELFKKKKKGKSVLQVLDTGTRVLDNTIPFWRSSIVCFWIPPTCSKKCKRRGRREKSLIK